VNQTKAVVQDLGEIIVLFSGKIITHGISEELLRDDVLRKPYLGL